MTEPKSTSSSATNLFLDTWLSSSEQIMRAQANWLTNFADTAESVDASEVVGLAKKSWDQCEAQFNHWVTSLEQCFSKDTQLSQSHAAVNHEQMLDAFEKLKLMLNPATFLSSGIDELNRVFQRLANGPDFADIGVFEKKIMRTGQDWSALCSANAEYQTVIASAWRQAFDRLLKEQVDEPQVKSIDFDGIMRRWLEVANESLIQTQRSDEFLAAQSKLIKANTQYKLKQREMIEIWCEAYSVPTRSEVDDLQLMVYELRRELRQLKKQVESSKNKARRSVSKSQVPTPSDQSSPLSTKPEAAKKPATANKQPTKKSAKKVKNAENTEIKNS